MTSNLSIIELKSLLTKFKKENKVKISGIHNMNKKQLIDECNKYKLLEDSTSQSFDIDLDKYSKKQLIADIEIFFLKQNKGIENIEKLSKQQLIDVMEQYNIPHNTPKQLEELLEEYTKINKLRDIINANYVKYGNFTISNYDIDNMSSDELNNFIDEHQLIREIESYDFINKLAISLISVYYSYCENKNKNCDIDKKNIPHILDKLKTICDI